MALPLLTRAAEDDGAFVLVSGRGSEGPSGLTRGNVAGVNRAFAPERLPAAGEQYRFHIDMDACIGCKCCVVACNEQNGNPAEINWRRVSEVEGGQFPAARRAHFSMGCNHCADPTCLAGCPVDAYSKDAATGIVLHSAETCIGCQYCTWTCSYGVPQFNKERGVVGKCDMCHGRLALGQSPACVSACPEGAIGIEIVNVADWRARSGPGDGRPVGDASLSTTRVTLPAVLPCGTRPVNDVPESADPHWPLAAMTVLTQVSAGAFAAIWLSGLVGGVGASAGVAAVSSLVLLFIGLGASTLHLGRPVHAYRAMKMWRRSWLSREVVLFGAFAKAAAAFSAALWFAWPGVALFGAATTVLGGAGVIASAFIYQVPSRPLWHSSRTFLQFFSTMFVSGALFAATFGLPAAEVWRTVAVVGTAAQLEFLASTWRALATSSSRELSAAHHLLRGSLRVAATVRVALLVAGGLVLPVASGSVAALASALVLLIAGELVGRYLFFVAAVPRHMTAPYLADREAA